jgi:hypothetical protein
VAVVAVQTTVHLTDKMVVQVVVVVVEVVLEH